MTFEKKRILIKQQFCWGGRGKTEGESGKKKRFEGNEHK